MKGQQYTYDRLLILVLEMLLTIGFRVTVVADSVYNSLTKLKSNCS